MAVTTPLTEKTMILNVGQPSGGWMTVTFAMWFPVTPGNELPSPSFVSAWSAISAKDPALLTALQNGQVIEQVYSHNFPSTVSLAQVETFLQLAWNAVSAYLAGVPQPGQFYGLYWDGNVWTKA